MSLYIGRTKINALNPILISGFDDDVEEVYRKDVNFFVNEKTAYTYDLSSVQQMSSLPPVPVKSDIFSKCEWNYSLQQLNNATSNTDVGTQYTTRDGRTRLYISIPENGLMKFRVMLVCSAIGGALVHWGDGSTSTNTQTTYEILQHTYSRPGKYAVQIEVIYGSVKLGNDTTTQGICGPSSGSNTDPAESYLGCIKKAIIGHTVMGAYCFQGCQTLQSIVLPTEKQTEINGRAFNQCRSLTTVVVPNTITNLKTYSFANCSALRSISIPMSVTTIGTYAFQYCYSLQHISFPPSVTSLGSFSLSYCQSLYDVVLPQNLTTIQTSLFLGCKSLQYIKIPASVTNIKAKSFQNCYGLQCIDMRNHTVIPTLENADFIDYASSTLKIVVPDALYSDWIVSTNWSDPGIVTKITKASEF